ncbi:hypothetical protein D1AOALGA4SA_9819 [Olavius algarvensis Delta 1 endosymbiont]|nr:hypothetical protein D1AOALGA4SA_9819 [Olavius algarvensis Delta 1 endosymbiont]
MTKRSPDNFSRNRIPLKIRSNGLTGFDFHRHQAISFSFTLNACTHINLD